MHTFELEDQRIRATEAWLQYLKICPQSDIDIYDLYALGYSYVEVREILLKLAESSQELKKESIHPMKHGDAAPTPYILC